ncbi:BCL-6 corepressor-like protein 1 isoform X2 [Cimex lectularius]|uniref:Uncharacterized protein n=1 Tax=Cimex lectularius TaxID=79782 RepID=A0A8I6STJ5_CIMLE|nr:BCL-6 corepressor-like protein 1 isoform X2 [Cimex lectularius]
MKVLDRPTVLAILLCLISTVLCVKNEEKGDTKKTKRGIFHGSYFDGGLGYGLAPPLYHLGPVPIVPGYHVPLPPPVVTRQVPVPVPVPVEKHVPVHVKVPVPFPVAVERHIPVHVRVPVAVPVPVEKHVPVFVDRPVIQHVPVDRPVPVPVDRPVPVPVPHAVPVPVPQPYPVYVNRAVPPVPALPVFPGAVPNSGFIPVPAPATPKEAAAPPPLHPGSPSSGYPVYHHPQYSTYDVEQFQLMKDHSSLQLSQHRSPNHSYGLYRHHPRHSSHKSW